MFTFAKAIRTLYRHSKNVQLLKHSKSPTRNYSEKTIILGIETSCDDTGCAVLDNEGNVLGEALHSQQLVHLNNGGIIPPIAQDLHRQNIESVVENAVRTANISYSDVTAIAATVRPGLPLSLKIGMKYGTHLCRKYNKPFIPIHHMEAHALTARMCQPVDFPFLVLLISGGHCLLAIAQAVDKFLLLGQSLDDAPGEAFDKAARRLKLKNLKEYSELSGGQAIEVAAKNASDPLRFKFKTPLTHRKDCNFSMAGTKTQFQYFLILEEKLHDVEPDGVIPTYQDLCAGFLLVITRHLCHRVQRAMTFAKLKGLIPEDKQTLVVSGGVACNRFIGDALKTVCDQLDYNLVIPPPKLCTDNGIMIAWNGLERYRINSGVTNDLNSVQVEKSSPLGRDISEEIIREQISCEWVKLNQFAKPQIEQNVGVDNF